METERSASTNMNTIQQIVDMKTTEIPKLL